MRIRAIIIKPSEKRDGKDKHIKKAAFERRDTGMKKSMAFFLILSLLALTLIPAAGFAEELPKQAAPQAAPAQDELVTTRHTAVIHGEEIAYTVTVGTMAVQTGGETCEFFFRAYTKDEVGNAAERPITFAFNGGPGSCSYYLEFGCLGPVRAEMSEDGHSLSMPPRYTGNENSLLDVTDLVFIDAIGTGYSRPAEGAELSSFIGYENDVRSFGDFIRQYVDRYKRWGSEKYIAGESYGTTRAVGICKYLTDAYAMNLNGLMLLSTVNDFSQTIPSVSNELPYALFFPTFAADAWYHGMLDERYQAMELEEYMDEVRGFVSAEYVPALFRGNRLTDAEREELAEKISAYLGLPENLVLEKNNRFSEEDFLPGLLREKNLMVGRLDGRYTGLLTGDGSDPSDVESDLMIGNAYYSYLSEELNYQTDRPYLPFSNEVADGWTSPDPEYGWLGGYFYQEEIIRECMAKNPYLKVWVNCGYYDAATPFHAAEWVYAHVFLDEQSSARLSFSYYPSGHMFYLEKASFDQFREEAVNWYRAS